MFNEPPVFPGRLDPSDRFRDRRHRSRRRRRLRRFAAVAVLCGGIVALALNARFISGDDDAPAARPNTANPTESAAPAVQTSTVRPLPAEIRGVHVTMSLASIDGKIDEYLAMQSDGLNTLEVDVKDENGDVAFYADAPALAQRVGAAQPYYDPATLAEAVHDADVYLIGRVVVFEDPQLAEARPSLAVRTRRWLRMAKQRRARLDEPVRAQGLGVQRRHR